MPPSPAPPVAPILVLIAATLATGAFLGRRVAPGRVFGRRVAGATAGAVATVLLALVAGEKIPRSAGAFYVLVLLALAGPGLASLVPLGLAAAERVAGERPSRRALLAAAGMCVMAAELWFVVFPVLLSDEAWIVASGLTGALAAVAVWAAVAYGVLAPGPAPRPPPPVPS